MLDLIADRFGDIEVRAPSDHGSYARIFSEMRSYAEHLGVGDAIGSCELRFVYSADMFSRVLRQITLNRKSLDSVDSKSLFPRVRTIVLIDLVGVHFFDRFTQNMLAPQRAIFEYIEGALTGTLLEIDLATFTTPAGSFFDILNAAPRALESDHPELIKKIRQTPNEFWDRSMLEILSKLRASMLHWLYERPPFEANFDELSALTHRIIMRFTLGHELGHCIRDNRAASDYWQRKVNELQLSFPDDDLPVDTELFCDCIAIDYCLYHSGFSEKVKYDEKIIIALLIVIISLRDSISVGINFGGQKPVTERGFYSGQKRTLYLQACIKAQHHPLDSTGLVATSLMIAADLRLVALAMSPHMAGMIEVIRQRAARRRTMENQEFAAQVIAFA